MTRAGDVFDATRSTRSFFPDRSAQVRLSRFASLRFELSSRLGKAIRWGRAPRAALLDLRLSRRQLSASSRIGANSRCREVMRKLWTGGYVRVRGSRSLIPGSTALCRFPLWRSARERRTLHKGLLSRDGACQRLGRSSSCQPASSHEGLGCCLPRSARAGAGC